MLLYTPFILFLVLNGVPTDTNAVDCDPGHWVTFEGRKRVCKPCKEGYFQPEKMQSKCNPCLGCETESGSFVQEKCTPVKNTKCQCRDGFSFLASDYSICQCNKGFGLTKRGDQMVCSECPPGHFNPDYDKPCKKMTDCKDAGVKVPGTPTSDAVCKEKSELTIASTSTSKRAASVTLVTPRQQQRGTRTPKTRPVITTTTSPLPKEPKGQPPSNTSSENHFGLGLLMIGIAGLLLLSAVTCKLHFTPCWKKKGAPHMEEDSFCKPVKESGDGIDSSLHLNPEP
ncbi:tumor necrosis factor receptor superfamily member 4 [Oryzias latipes]|uniref:TNFR-Cys domain-containing protein n=1 Tax=Oryzias latipes TaxID=8090 RepID=A0A3B3HH89_ORYLA|nr:tumor necrosis factor receptor superfamily member 4 [Oryzias latipes]XP_023810605.1 tumor necrosis factor receptor superfamily member 4 [Oryzias latipes]